MLYFNSPGNRPNRLSPVRVQQIMISHYATGGPGQHLLPGLEEATSDDKSPVLVFILTVNNDCSQTHWRGLYVLLCHIGSGISGLYSGSNLSSRNPTCLECQLGGIVMITPQI